ncbi:hypothetical protein DL93DRAFT_2169881 [Clavulina sp. PMI_390]|nr:hypothetical protein DL93DRAFT_2169881 [Clavulina sp. PMI_390]
MSSSSDYAAAVEVPNVSAVAAVPGLAVNDGHSGHKIAVFDGLPIEIFLLIIDHLEIFSVIRFSMASRSLYDFVHSRAVSMALALRCLHVEKIPATSFLLPQMESSELVKLITRVDRFIWAANRTSLSKDPPRGKRTNINLVIPDSAEAFYPLGMYEAEDDRQYPHARSALLPGGRWVVTISGATRWHFSCYDLQDLIADGFYEPVATIAIKPDREEVPLLIQEFEYCKGDSAFTFIISSQEPYMIRDELFTPGWHCIIRVHIEPVSSAVTISNVPLPPFYHTRDWHLNLSGDFVSFESLDSWIAFDNLAPSQALMWD